MKPESLFPYQITGAQWLSVRTHALLADTMGLGKSAQAVRAADMVGAETILVVCPAIARPNWEREFTKFSPMDRPIFPVMSGKDGLPTTPGVVIISYDLVRSHLENLKTRVWDLVILDEAHYLKERMAKRTKALYGYGKKFAGVISTAKRVWRLTGTPAPNNASELWSHLRSAGLAPEDYFDFVSRYCTGFDSNYGFKITGHRNAEELKERMRGFMLRRLKSEVLKDLPAIQFQDVVVERSSILLDDAFYAETGLKRGSSDAFEDIQVAEISLRQALNEISKDREVTSEDLALIESSAPFLPTLRMYVGLAKCPTICEVIAQDLDDGMDKIVLFAIHRKVVNSATKLLSRYGAVSVHGHTDKLQRQANIDRFNNDPGCRVFVGNIQAAGTCITLTSACEAAFLEQSWTPSDNLQAAMRVHRIGQTRNVRVRNFGLYGSVDEQVQTALTRKVRELAKII